MGSQPKVSGFNAPGGWSWPEDIRHRRPDTNPTKSTTPSSSFSSHTSDAEQSTREEPPKQKYYKPRTCRICLESVPPTYEPPSTSLPSYLQGPPNVTYVSEDGGRLIRPCKCKGSQRYVHEGCLQEWRHADPSYGARNFWQCPTCGFKYRLERMRWGRWISSKAAQVILTLVIFLGTVFLIGFVADPIINAYVDPVSWVFTNLLGDDEDYNPRYNRRFNERRFQKEVVDSSGWGEHFLKGFAGLGVLGFLKVILGLSQFHWLRVRGGGLFGGGGMRVGNSGRDRVGNLRWFVLIIGVCTFLYTVWKGVRALSRRFLEKAGERVMDVPLATGEAEDDEDD